MISFLIFTIIVSSFYLFSGILRSVVFLQRSGRPEGKEWLMLLAVILLWPFTIYRE